MKTINPSTACFDVAQHPSKHPERSRRTALSERRESNGRSRTIKFFTLGCKVNQYDTQDMRENFLRAGFTELENGVPADIYVINTCTVTHKADKSSLYLIRRAGRENPKAKIIVTGCLAELDSVIILREPGVDLLVKNRDKPRILELVGCKAEKKEGSQQKGISYFQGRCRAFLKIQDGCNNFCAYCKVPLVRGNSRSKPHTDVVGEAQRLVDNGFKEIVLTGICLGDYGRDLPEKTSLVDIICALEKIQGLVRIRLSSIESGHVTEGLIRKMSDSSKLCRHLHIPIQSGDDEILRKMNRKYTSRDYLLRINELKRRIPGISITTDVLVGFPDEGEANFKNTVSLIREVVPLRTHIFPYSERKETSAAVKSSEDIDSVILKRRIASLRSVADKCAINYKKKFLGKVMDVLLEALSDKMPETWEGHTGNYIKVLVKSKSDLKNRLVRAKLNKISGEFIMAELSDE